MYPLLDVNVQNDTLVTIALVVAIIVGVLWIIAWLMGRPWRP